MLLINLIKLNFINNISIKLVKMTTIHNVPIELFRDIFKFCDAKSIINLGKTNCFFIV